MVYLSIGSESAFHLVFGSSMCALAAHHLLCLVLSWSEEQSAVGLSVGTSEVKSDLARRKGKRRDPGARAVLEHAHTEDDS